MVPKILSKNAHLGALIDFLYEFLVQCIKYYTLCGNTGKPFASSLLNSLNIQYDLFTVVMTEPMCLWSIEDQQQEENTQLINLMFIESILV